MACLTGLFVVYQIQILLSAGDIILVPTYVMQEIHEGLVLSTDDDEDYSVGIFSVKFSTDGRELVAGSSDDSIYMYDLEANKVTSRILAHTV